ncbi:MAG: hypothetical protein U0U67_04890 [Chitinophagales bacterium]
MQQQNLSEEDIRIVDILDSFGSYIKYMIRKWYILLVGVGGLTYFGYYYAKTAPANYVAYTSFNSVDSRVSAMGGMMSMMGISFAGGSSVDVLTGIFSSRNIFISALLNEVDINGKPTKLANYYLHVFKYDEGFKDDPKLKNFKFTANSIDELSATELDIATMLYGDFSDGFFTAEYDMTTGLIKAEIETPDFELSKTLARKMLDQTVFFYQKKQLENAKISLSNSSKRLDSITGEITARQKLIAESQDQNIFNKKKINVVDQQKLMQELQTLNVMYSDATSTKESSKAGLTLQNNLVRIIDAPEYSTYPKNKSKLLYSLIAFAVSIVVVIIPLILSKAIKDGREENKLREAQQKAALNNTATA